MLETKLKNIKELNAIDLTCLPSEDVQAIKKGKELQKLAYSYSQVNGMNGLVLVGNDGLIYKVVGKCSCLYNFV